MRPLVSVVMPAYNAEKYIEFAIESVLRQTYANLELIIIEDCSTDNTYQVIQNYQDKRIKILKNDRNMGIAYSTNKGIGASQGEYIALLDDDDIAVENRLEMQVKYLRQHREIDILGGHSAKIDDKGKIIGFANTPRHNPQYIKAMLLFGNLDFCNSTAMIRRQFVEKNHLFYRENCYGMQDFRFYMESSKVGNISSIGNLLLYYRVHNQNETRRRKELYKKERAEAYAGFQRESLRKSGFLLDEKVLGIINRTLVESGAGCRNKEDLQELYLALSEVLRQAKEMKVDYYQELEHVCKSKLAMQIVKMDIFQKEE